MTPVWKHVKTGGLYTVHCNCALIEADMTEVTVYESVSTGQVWVRPTAEFRDGSFVLVQDEAGAVT